MKLKDKKCDVAVPRLYNCGLMCLESLLEQIRYVTYSKNLPKTAVKMYSSRYLHTQTKFISPEGLVYTNAVKSWNLHSLWLDAFGCNRVRLKQQIPLCCKCPWSTGFYLLLRTSVTFHLGCLLKTLECWPRLYCHSFSRYSHTDLDSAFSWFWS